MVLEIIIGLTEDKTSSGVDLQNVVSKCVYNSCEDTRSHNAFLSPVP